VYKEKQEIKKTLTQMDLKVVEFLDDCSIRNFATGAPADTSMFD
jgi:hypothetical protein